MQADPAFHLPLFLSNRLLFLVVSFASLLMPGVTVGVSGSREPWTHLPVYQYFSGEVLLPSTDPQWGNAEIQELWRLVFF